MIVSPSGLIGGKIDTIVATLRQSHFGEALTDGDLQRVAACMTVCNFQAGQIVCQSRELALHAYFVARGRAKVTLPESRGGGRLVTMLRPGDHFGSYAMIDEAHYGVDVTAVENCVLLRTDKQAFQVLYAEVPSLGKALIRSLGSHFRDSVLSERRNRNLRVLGIVSSDIRPHAVVRPLIAALIARGERVAHICPVADSIAAANCLTEPLTDKRGYLRPADELKERIDHLLRNHHRIIVDLHGEFPLSDTVRVLSMCDEVFGLFDSSCQHRSQHVCRELLTIAPELAPRMRTVWVLRPPELVTPICKTSLAVDNHNFVVQLADSPQQPTRLQQQGIDRLVRHLLGIRLGLALGGGAARGMAHLGVLKAFNQAGISFDMVAGTSAGAMVGVPYAAGYEPEVAIQRYTADLTPSQAYRWLPGGLQWYLMLKYRTGAWDKMLRKYFFDWNLEQLQIPMYTVAVDLVSGRQIVRDRGDAVHAIAESINLPLLSRPICRDGMALVDGGVLNTLPTQVLADRGADLVVGVSVSGKIRHEFSGNHIGMKTSVMRRPGTLQTLRRVLETQDHALKAIDAQAADLLIEPDATSFDMADFSRTPEIAAAGEAAAEKAIGHLKKMVADLERRAMQQIGAAVNA